MRSERADLFAGVHENRQDVRQVVFALRVVIVDFSERTEEFLHVEAVNTGVDFLDFFLEVVSVFFLDDFFKRAVGIANDSAVACSVGHFCG